MKTVHTMKTLQEWDAQRRAAFLPPAQSSKIIQRQRRMERVQLWVEALRKRPYIDPAWCSASPAFDQGRMNHPRVSARFVLKYTLTWIDPSSFWNHLVSAAAQHNRSGSQAAWYDGGSP